MRKLLLIIVAMALAGLVFAQGEKVKSVPAENKVVEQTTVTQNIQKYDVSFIELGSVKCIPCKMMQPILADIEKEYPNVKVVFYDVWTVDGEPYAQQYKIRGIPTQVFLDRNGKEYFRHTGFFPKEELIKVLEEGFKK